MRQTFKYTEKEIRSRGGILEQEIDRFGQEALTEGLAIVEQVHLG
jgi:hypothetical protein